MNNELTVLREAGCYADFTFPAWGRMQPAKSNSIYYATDDPTCAKSYDTGVDVEVGKPTSGDLMIFQGSGRLSGIPRAIGRLPIVGALARSVFRTCAINALLPPTPRRVDQWVEANVHVAGRPEWVFVKAHTHGARLENGEVYFGEPAKAMYGHLNARYNDGAEWRLHYATAREAYNMVKAAEAGKTGDPEEFRDFGIARYQNTR